MNENSEALLVEKPAIELFAALGYKTINASKEKFGPGGTLGRETTSEVVLVRHLRAALQKLNPHVSSVAIEQAIEIITDSSRAVKSLIAANQELYKLLKDGIQVNVPGDKGEPLTENIRVIEWRTHTENDFLLVSQLTITNINALWTKRPDVIGFVNGLPLVLCEFKASHKAVEDAYNDNLSDYKDTIPHLFWYNALLIISNGTRSLLGSMTAGLEHFFEWKRIESEDEEGAVSLETLLRGTCEPRRLLDIVENFTLFTFVNGESVKILARNHQYLGVNNALEAVHGIRHNQGRLGVFWHTQGSGKSFSMIFFSQKVQRTITGNWTFVIVTDRNDLDTQIYQNFAYAGAITELEKDVHAEDGKHLKELLRADHRVVFTLIQKFRVAPGQTYEQLSDRSDIIVMTDEAHRSQYDILAHNMRNALPKAAFIGFTGTPLMADGSEGETRRVFGDYVSIYNFRTSVEDGTTVPLYYENRIPELQLTTAQLNEAIAHIVDEAGLDVQQEQRIARKFEREYLLITSDDRLDKIAQDIVVQFMGRGWRGKAMVVSIDKITTVRMYHKVRKYWDEYIEALETRQAASKDKKDKGERLALAETIGYMKATDMAVVLSQGQHDIQHFKDKGLDILPHRTRIVKEDLESKFKNPDDALRLVFVCAMWITGFDVPSLSTIYLDKPMTNHTLMQTIARANRVFQDKVNGLIVDYIGVFRDLQKALAIYGTGSGGGIQDGDNPVADKRELIARLELALDDLIILCKDHDVDPQAILAVTGLERLNLLADADDALLVNDEVKKQFLSQARHVIKLHKATLPLPDGESDKYTALIHLFKVMVGRLIKFNPPQDIQRVLAEIEELVDTSLTTRNYIIREAGEYDEGHYIDLSKIDFEALRLRFATERKHIEIEKLRGAITTKLDEMVKLNKSRVNYQEKLQKLIDDYNTGSTNSDVMLEQLLTFIQSINQEDQRHIAEHLSEEELAVFDMLINPDISLSEKERTAIKKVVRDVLDTLKREQLILDWRKKQQAQARVRKTIRDAFYSTLPQHYAPEAYEHVCDSVFQHVYNSYAGEGRSIYAAIS